MTRRHRQASEKQPEQGQAGRDWTCMPTQALRTEQQGDDRAAERDALEHDRLEVLVLTRFWASECGIALGCTPWLAPSVPLRLK